MATTNSENNFIDRLKSINWETYDPILNDDNLFVKKEYTPQDHESALEVFMKLSIRNYPCECIRDFSMHNPSLNKGVEVCLKKASSFMRDLKSSWVTTPPTMMVLALRSLPCQELKLKPLGYNFLKVLNNCKSICEFTPNAVFQLGWDIFAYVSMHSCFPWMVVSYSEIPRVTFVIRTIAPSRDLLMWYQVILQDLKKCFNSMIEVLPSMSSSHLLPEMFEDDVFAFWFEIFDTSIRDSCLICFEVLTSSFVRDLRDLETQEIYKNPFLFVKIFCETSDHLKLSTMRGRKVLRLPGHFFFIRNPTHSAAKGVLDYLASNYNNKVKDG